jgi:hypothetical protein
MSDKEELFEGDDKVEEKVEEKPKLKPKRSRKPLSDERKQQLREQLAKAREQSAIKRGERALAKRLEKQEKDDDVNNKLKKYAKKKGIITDDNVDELKEQIATLKKQLESKGQPLSNPPKEESPHNDDDIKKELKEMRLALKVMREQNKKEKEVSKVEEPKVEEPKVIENVPTPTPVSLNSKYRRKKRWIKD